MDADATSSCEACGEGYPTDSYPALVPASWGVAARYSTVCKWCTSKAKRRIPGATVQALQEAALAAAATLPPKTCPACQKTKPGAAFNAGVGVCRKCHPRNDNPAAQDRSWKTRRETCRARYLAYLSTHPCVDCGDTDPLALECDHRADKGPKHAGVAYMVAEGKSWTAIEAEIAKCEVRCVRCHRRRTLQATGSWLWDAVVNGNMPVDRGDGHRRGGR